MSKWEEIIKEHFYNKEGVEASKKNVCKMGIEIESCRRCIFEALCRYQDMIKRNKVWIGWEENYNELNMVD